MAGPGTLYQSGNHASRPASGDGCVIYWCTDHNKFYRDDGSAWADLADLSSVGGNALSVTRVSRSTNQNVAGSGTPTVASWDTELVDDDGLWAIGDPTDLNIPVGLNGRKAIVRAQVLWSASASGNYRQLELKQGSTVVGNSKLPDTGAAVSQVTQVESHVITLATSDVITLEFAIDATGIGLTGNTTYNWLELRTVD